jgi:hypothetical protein
MPNVAHRTPKDDPGCPKSAIATLIHIGLIFLTDLIVLGSRRIRRLRDLI